MVVVGLTGGIGSGKSTVGKLLAKRGAAVIEADEVAREVVEPGRPAHRAILERFGHEVLAPDGSLDRSALARVVFADPAARADLEAITHPAVGRRIAERLAELAARGEHDVVVLDIPLLAEKGRGSYPLAGVLVVDVPVEVAIARLVEGRGMDEADARARVAAQASREERLALADFVIDNSGSLEDLAREVDRAWAFIEGLAVRAEAGR